MRRWHRMRTAGITPWSCRASGFGPRGYGRTRSPIRSTAWRRWRPRCCNGVDRARRASAAAPPSIASTPRRLRQATASQESAMAQPTTVPPTQELRLAMSYEEYASWADEDTRAEWVDGEVTVFMPPSIVHAKVAGFLHALLMQFA